MIPVSELKHMSTGTLISIFRTGNNWEWPPELGEVPDGWEQMQTVRLKDTPADVVTREDILTPYLRYIGHHIPQSVIYPESCADDQLLNDLISMALLGVIVLLIVIFKFCGS